MRTDFFNFRIFVEIKLHVDACGLSDEDGSER